MTQPRTSSVELTSTVCDSCRERKQKCDKRWPTCSRCERLLLKCCYAVPTTARGPWIPPDEGLLFQSLTTPEHALAQDLNRVPDWSMSSLSHIASLVSKHRRQIEILAQEFLMSCQKWFPIVHRDTFANRYHPALSHGARDSNTLLLAMGLVTRPFVDKLREPIYNATKRLFWDPEAMASPTLHLIQAGLLLSVHEYGQGLLNASYLTISVCISMAYVVGIRPTQSPPPFPVSGSWSPSEAGLRTWWAIAIHERMISLKSGFPTRPLQLCNMDILDNRDIDSEVQEIIRNVVSNPLYDHFVLQTRAAIWLDVVLELVQSSSTMSPEGRLHFQLVDRSLLVFLQSLVHLGLGYCCEAIAISLSAFVHLHKWRLTSPSPAFSQQERFESSTAIKTILTVLSDLALDRLRDGSPEENEYLYTEQFPYFIHMAYQVMVEILRVRRISQISSNTFEAQKSMIWRILQTQSTRWKIAGLFFRPIYLLPPGSPRILTYLGDYLTELHGML
ncbi:uncharacterized protein KD926_005185 [Aspergillus affinis]|uniref:uncharacterized protein n=1 Tax=Aspergillus affinis TaxID=1070780 RepID=UPI0022FEA318|nr:uncharacterized protein KD926_005185 [Aspergillus affinis]KAI9034863.1 hypothetical protein KD926_005185 [Aspergillus affinis]